MFRIALVLLFLVFTPSHLLAKTVKYDIAYIWDDNIENVLDYQTQLEELLGSKTARHLRIVGRSAGGFGIIYDHNGTALSSAQLMVQQSEILRNAGLAECTMVEDHGYYELYNVSYGLGPNLAALKKRYSRIYTYFGREVGKDLYIEQTDAKNYTLIYRRRGDRSSTYSVAKKHARLLKRKKISTTIIPEKNNPVVFGESSHLDDTTPAPATIAKAVKPKTGAIPQQKKTVVSKKVAPTPVASKSKVSSGKSLDVEETIEAYIRELRQKGKLTSDEKTSWLVYDLTREKSLVDINADQIFQAASMIKPFVALAFFHRVDQGGLIYGPKSRRKMELMIQRSDNAATNWVMRMAGGPAKIDEVLRTSYGTIFKNTSITEYIPAGGKTYKNSALPSDYIRFLQALWDNKLTHGKEIRRLMSLPGRDRLYSGTPIPEGTLVYNKTGSTAYLCGDMGILVPRDKDGRRYPYALVGIIERSSRAKDYGRWMLTRGNVIRQVSTLVYQEMKKQYQLM
jgi:beta-lactamase class A